LTGASYYHFLHDDLPLLLDKALDNMPMNRRQELWFLIDGVRPHYSRQVRDFLKRTLLVIKKIYILLLLLLFEQVDQQDVPITGQPSKRQSKNKKRNKTSNHQTVIKNQQNYSNPYHATSILLQVSNERVEIAPLNSIDATTKHVNHTLNFLIIDHHPDDRPVQSRTYPRRWIGGNDSTTISGLKSPGFFVGIHEGFSVR
jgi:hypothetical protein